MRAIITIGADFDEADREMLEAEGVPDALDVIEALGRASDPGIIELEPID